MKLSQEMVTHTNEQYKWQKNASPRQLEPRLPDATTAPQQPATDDAPEKVSYAATFEATIAVIHKE